MFCRNLVKSCAPRRDFSTVTQCGDDAHSRAEDLTTGRIVHWVLAIKSINCPESGMLGWLRRKVRAYHIRKSNIMNRGCFEGPRIGASESLY